MAIGCPCCGHAVSLMAKMCPNCGEPFDEENSYDMVPCGTCHGRTTDFDGFPCKSCSGTGFVKGKYEPGEQCPACSGTGGKTTHKVYESGFLDQLFGAPRFWESEIPDYVICSKCQGRGKILR